MMLFVSSSSSEPSMMLSMVSFTGRAARTEHEHGHNGELEERLLRSRWRQQVHALSSSVMSSLALSRSKDCIVCCSLGTSMRWLTLAMTCDVFSMALTVARPACAVCRRRRIHAAMGTPCPGGLALVTAGGAVHAQTHTGHGTVPTRGQTRCPLERAST